MTEELRCLVLLARNNDQSAFAALLSRYSPMIESLLLRIRTAQMSEEDIKDLRQEAYVCFYRALTRYDMEQNEVDFGLYAKICVERGLISAMRGMKHLSAAPTLPLDELEEFEDTEAQGDPSALLVQKESFEHLYAQVCRLLSPYENEVWRLYTAGYSAGAIATRTGKEEKSIHNAIYRIRKKLRAALDVRGQD